MEIIFQYVVNIRAQIDAIGEATVAYVLGDFIIQGSPFSVVVRANVERLVSTIENQCKENLKLRVIFR